MVLIQFGGRVEYHRELLGLTQAELGKRIGVTGAAVCHWEGGKRTPYVSELPKIAQALRTTIVELFLPVPGAE